LDGPPQPFFHWHRVDFLQRDADILESLQNHQVDFADSLEGFLAAGP
jgi:hypothetical protein